MALTYSVYSILVENNLTLLPSSASNYFISAASGSTTYFNVDNKGNLSTLGGHLASATYSGSYTDGTVIDYAIGNGRISVGPNDNLSIYNNGIAGTTVSIFGTNSITNYQYITWTSGIASGTTASNDGKAHIFGPADSSLSIKGLNGTIGYGVNIIGGDGTAATTGIGGDINIIAGNANAATGSPRGGNIYISAGWNTLQNAASGGTVTIQGGNISTTPGNGLILQTRSSGSISSGVSSVLIQPGNGGGAAQVGNIYITTPSILSLGGNTGVYQAGSVYINLGTGSVNTNAGRAGGSGGGCYITTGNGGSGTGNFGGSGGPYSIVTGNGGVGLGAGSTGGNGGNISLVAGIGATGVASSGLTGSIILTSYNVTLTSNGNLSTLGGYLSIGTYSSTFSSGIVVDYATSNGRISVGSNANISLYTGGIANTPISIFGTNSVITYQPLTVNATYSTTSAAANINISGYNTKGGSTYLDFLAATNTVSGATNPTKWFRIDNTGTLQIINSLYSSALFSLTDGGALTLVATSSSAALSITQNGASADCLLQLNSRNTGTWTRIGSNGSSLAIITGGTDLTNGTPAIHISSLNNVGINGVASRARLDIYGAIAGYTSTQTYAYYALGSSNTNTGYYNGTSQTITPSIWADQRVLAVEFDAISDERIKDIKGISNNAEDLELLKQIQITDYQYKDKIANGTNNFKKVIGQQVQKVFPQAVKEQKDIVPDIFKLANIINGVVQLVADVKEGDTIKLIAQTGELKVKVISVNEENFTIDKPINEECFIYGKEVDDFVVVDYDALSMLNISATQEIIKRLELLEKENEELRKLLK